MSEAGQATTEGAPGAALAAESVSQPRPPRKKAVLIGRPPEKGFRMPRSGRGPFEGLGDRARSRKVRCILEYAAMGEKVPGWQIGAAVKLLDSTDERRELRARVRELEREVADLRQRNGAGLQVVFMSPFKGGSVLPDGESVALPSGVTVLDAHKG